MVPTTWASSSWVKGIVVDAFPLFEDLSQVEQSAPHPRVDRHIERVDELYREPSDLGHEGLDQHAPYRRLTGPKGFELRAVDAERLHRIDGHGGGVPRPGRDDGELAEEVAGLEHPHGRDITQRGREPDGDVAVCEEVQRVAGIACVKDHFVTGKATPAGETQELALLVVRQDLEDRPLRRHSVEGPVMGWVGGPGHEVHHSIRGARGASFASSIRRWRTCPRISANSKSRLRNG